MVVGSERWSILEIRKLSMEFTRSHLVTEALDLAGVMILVINEARQVVYANKLMLEGLQKNTLDEVLGLRPGEAISCIHAGDVAGGCGMGPSCNNCSALNLVLNGISSNDSVSDDVVIQRRNDSAISMMTRIVPYQINGSSCFVISMQDNSDKIRRRELERLFFHDILNATGAIKNYLSLLSENAPLPMKEDVVFLDLALGQTIEDIQIQRALGDAEHAEYAVVLTAVSPEDVLKGIVAYFRYYREKDCKKIHLVLPEQSFELMTDARLLRRILINMTKNALEASATHDEIILSCEIIQSSPLQYKFSVKNPGIIPEAVRQKIFTRSFSTKGFGRGIGTYSMKLFGEKYLEAQVGFTSTKEEGTEFYILIPQKRLVLI